MKRTLTSVSEIKKHLKERIQQACTELGIDTSVELAPPPNPEMGDWGFPCFAFAKVLRQAPPKIAEALANRLPPDEIIERVTTDKAYVNLHLRKSALIPIVLGQILREKERYGARQVDPVQHWMVEFSSPNTNKPLHLGHMRNNVLGASISTILEFYGHRVTRVNLINDRGVHICKSMLAYKKWGEGTDLVGDRSKGDHLVGDFYVLFDRRFADEYLAWQSSTEAQNKLAAWRLTQPGKDALQNSQSDPQAPAPTKVFFDEYRDTYFNTESPLGGEVRQMLRQWEEGDTEVLELWRKLNHWVLAGFKATYERMGVRFDLLQYESETYKLGKKLVEEGLARGLLQRLDDGAVVCDLSQVGLNGEKVLLRADGTSVYMTQDLGTAAERFDKYHIDHLVYVVGDEQIYHFDVLFRVLGLLRPGLTDACYHLAYGMIRLPEGKMKSREGTVVDADDLLDELHCLARAETMARAEEGKVHVEGISSDELERRSELIGLSAIKYFLLKYTPRKSFEYNPKESIDFLGQTGPYCLFNYARTRSLQRKAGGTEALFDEKLAARLGTDREMELIRLLMEFPKIVEHAASALDPSRIAEYLFDLCKSFAFIFTDKANHPIVTCEDQDLRQARLMLVDAIGYTLRAGLGLLGIDVLEEM